MKNKNHFWISNFRQENQKSDYERESNFPSQQLFQHINKKTQRNMHKIIKVKLIKV